MSDVTHILAQAEEGDITAGERLPPLAYSELRKLAARRMTQEAPGHMLQPTSLVEEA